MIISIWFTLVWAAASGANAWTCIALAQVELLSQWTFLFALCADEVISFAILQYHWPYHIYFWIFWINAAVVSVLRIGLAYDVLRSIPAYRIISLQTRKRVLLLAIGAACAFTYFAGCSPSGDALDFILALNRCVIFAWAIVLFGCLIGIFAVGYGFTITGIRIATGMIIRLISTMAAALVYTSNLPPITKTHVNVLDTIVGLCVAAYWCFSVYEAPRADAEFRKDWVSNRHILLPPTEKAG